MAKTEDSHSSKRRTFSIEERLQILGKLEAGERIIDLAGEYKVNASTIATIKKSKDHILRAKQVLQSYDGDLGKRKRFRGTECKKFEIEVYNWFRQQREFGLAVPGYFLQQKALQLNKKYNGPANFKASNGWLDRFKTRCGIRSLIVQGEDKSDQHVASQRFIMDLSNLINVCDTKLDYIYNCKETGLFWKLLPNKINETCRAEMTNVEDRITVMICTNASSSHKIPLYVIGKTNKYECFQNLQNLPVYYEYQASAWMDPMLMMDWYTNMFIPEVKKKHNYEQNSNIKIILIMDNVSSHPTEDEFNAVDNFCRVLFLPTSVALLIQPFDQGIIEHFKINYKKLLLSRIFISNTSEEINSAFRKFSLLDCLKCCARAWDEITSYNIRNCWKNLIPLNDSASTLNNETIDLTDFHSFVSKLPGCTSMTLDEVKHYLSYDKNECEWGNNLDTKDNLLEMPVDGYHSNDDEHKFFIGNNESVISINLALEGLSNFIKWYENQQNCSQSTLTMLEDLNQNTIDQIISEKYN